MAAPDYDVQTLDLATARDRERRLLPGQPYDGVTILEMPAGAGVEFHFGEGRQGIPQVGAGLSWEVEGRDERGCPVPANEGFFVSNPAGAGNLVLLISFGAQTRLTGGA